MKEILMSFYKICQVSFTKGKDTPSFWSWLINQFNEKVFRDNPKGSLAFEFAGDLLDAAENELKRRFNGGKIDSNWDYTLSVAIALSAVMPRSMEEYCIFHRQMAELSERSAFISDVAKGMTAYADEKKKIA